MLLFSREGVYVGHIGELMPKVQSVVDRVNELVEDPLSVWASVAGMPAGTLTFTGFMENHEKLGENNAKVLADNEWWDRVGSLREHSVGETTDEIREIIHGTPSPENSVAWGVTAQIAPGQIANAMGWAIEIAEKVGSLAGSETVVLRDLYGPWGQMTWITGFADMASVDAAQAAMAADPGYITMLDQGGDLFIPGTASQRLATKLI